MNFMSFLRAQILTTREPVTPAINTTNYITQILIFNQIQFAFIHLPHSMIRRGGNDMN